MDGGLSGPPPFVSARYPPLEHIQNPPQPDPKVTPTLYGSTLLKSLAETKVITVCNPQTRERYFLSVVIARLSYAARVRKLFDVHADVKALTVLATTKWDLTATPLKC